MSATQDKASAGMKLHVGGVSVLTQLGSGISNVVKNFAGFFEANYSDSSSGIFKCPIVMCRTSPVGDTDYANLPIGTIFVQVEFTTKVASDAALYLKTGSGIEKLTNSLDAYANQTMSLTTIAQTTAATLTAAQLQGSLIARDPAGASKTDVTPTAALIVAGIPACIVGSSIRFVIMNDADAAEAITISAGVGVTLNPTTVTIPRGCRREFLAYVTNATAAAEAVTIYEMGDIENIRMTAIAGDLDISNTSSGTVAATGVLSTDEIIATLKTTTNAVGLRYARAGTGGNILFGTDGDPGASSDLHYEVRRAR